METSKNISSCPICGCKKFKLVNEIDTRPTSIYCNNCPYGLVDDNKTLSELVSIHNNNITFLKIRNLEDRLIELGELANKPCFICGYKGSDYFDPVAHECMNRGKGAGYMKNYSLTDDDLYE